MSDELDFVDQLKELERSRQQLLHGQGVAGRFLDNSSKRLSDIEDQIAILKQFMGVEEEEDTLKPVEPIDEKEGQMLEVHPRPGDTVRRGARTAKEKQELVEESENKRQEARESAQQGESSRPSQPQRPQQPGEPGKGLTPEQQRQLTPDERKNEIRKKLLQRDPRKMKEGLEALKKPENKGLADNDKEFSKLIKGAEDKVDKYDKIQNALRRNLKTLMQSASQDVKESISDLRQGKIGKGVVGLKSISNSSDIGNEMGMAATNIINGINELYREFDIKPEEALTNQLLEESRPVITRETSEKSKDDRNVDEKSMRNRYLGGPTKELTEEDRKKLEEIKKITGTDKIPPVEKHADMKMVEDIVQDIAQNPQKGLMVATIIAKGKGNE